MTEPGANGLGAVLIDGYESDDVEDDDKFYGLDRQQTLAGLDANNDAEADSPPPPRALEEAMCPISEDSRMKLEKFVGSTGVQIGVLVAILIDVIVVILELSVAESDLDESAISVITTCTLTYLSVEIVLTLVYMDVKPFFRDYWCVFDLFITFVSLIVTILEETLVDDGPGGLVVAFRSLRVVRRLLRVCRVARAVHKNKARLPRVARRMVSADRRRYKKDGFDIDVTYITQRILSMSVPATKVEALYRNPVADVARFFNTKHGDHYRVYNLVPERKYPYDDFVVDGQCAVKEMYCSDHNPAGLARLLEFCLDAEAYLSDDPKNVVVVHCKGGKGRTGTFVSSFLLYSLRHSDGPAAMQFFGQQRTADTCTKFQGVESPSQGRFIGYFADVVYKMDKQLPPTNSLLLSRVRVRGVQLLPSEISMVVFDVSSYPDRVLFESGPMTGTQQDDEKEDYVDFVIDKSLNLYVENDVKIGFCDSKHGKGHPLFLYWFHTSFVENSFTLVRDEIDGPHKKKKRVYFPDHFSIETTLEPGAL